MSKPESVALCSGCTYVTRAARPQSGDPCPHCGEPLQRFQPQYAIELPDADVDVPALLEPHPEDEERHHDFLLGDADLRILARALRGDDPRDDLEREDRRRLLRGLCYQLNDYEEVAVE